MDIPGKTLVLAHREYHDDPRPLAHAKMTVEAPGNMACIRDFRGRSALDEWEMLP